MLRDPDAGLLAARVDRLAKIRPIYTECLKGKGQAVGGALMQARALGDAERPLLAERILAAPEVFEGPAVEFALVEAVRSPFPGRGRALAKGLHSTSFVTVENAIKAMRKIAPEPDEVLAEDLEEVLATSRPPGTGAEDFVAKMGHEKMVKSVTAWLAKRSSGDPIEGLLAQLETANDDVKESIVESALNPFDEGYLLTRMTDDQALRAARILVELRRDRKDNVQLSNAAGHQLYRFSHRGAQAFLLDRLAHEPRDDEDLIQNLYSAVRSMDTPASKEALVDQLFLETRCFWWLGSALADIWTPALHRRILETIRSHEDAAKGASRYAAALVEHVKKTPPLVELGLAVAELDGDADRRAYVLWEAARAALVEGRLDAAQTLVDAARALGAKGASDYHTIDRKRPWKNPFRTDKGLAQQLVALDSGALGKTKAKSKARGAKAKAKRKPMLRLSDEALGDLADAKVHERLFHDAKTGVVWARTEDDRFLYFDGFEATAPPFEVVVDPELHAFLKKTPGLALRRTFWNKGAKRFVDVARYGERVVLGWGENNGPWKLYGLAFTTEAAARAAMKAYAPPKGFAESEPWYVAGKGAIVRILYHPKANGSYNADRVWTVATEKKDVAAAEALYWATLRRKGTRAVSVEWSKDRKRKRG